MVGIVEKEQSSVIGKLGKGFADEDPQWIRPLWQGTISNFIEIINLAIHFHVQVASVCFVKELIRT